MHGRRRQFSALAAALGLHAALLGVLRVTLGERFPEARLPSAPAHDAAFELELDDVPAFAAPSDAVPPIARVEEPAAQRSVSHAQARVESEPSTAELETVEQEPVAALPASPVAPRSKPIDLGLGPDGWQRWMTAPLSGDATPAAAPTVRSNRYQVFRAARVSTTGGLQEGLEASDRALALGLGPEGRVVSASRKAAHAPEAPEAGVARFEVTVRRTGAVEVTLGATTAQREQWQQVAARIAKDLRSAPPKIPPPREGFKLVIEVVAEHTLPNGTKAKSLKKAHVDAPLKFQSTDASVAQMARENPTTVNPTPDDIALKLDTPGVYVAESNGVCDYRAGLGFIAPGYGLGGAAGPAAQGACDPSNIGAKAQRVVRTRVLTQSLF